MKRILENWRSTLLDNGFISVGPLAISRKAALADLRARLRLLQGMDVAAAADGGTRSVVFVNNAYYNFFYLASALRKRGWKAISVSLENPEGPNKNYFHGWDRCLFHEDKFEMSRQIADFLLEVQREYRMVHFYGKGHLTFLPTQVDNNDRFDTLPFDLVQLKQRGIKVGYSVCGCLDGVAQSSVYAWSGGCCDRCVWQTRPEICSDRGNLAWGHKLHMLCDLIASEGFPALDYQSGAKVVREPLTTALDPEFWSPDLTIPQEHRLERGDGELIVYHGVGNFDARSQGGRNLKGTQAVVEAIERMRAEGINVRLQFAKDIPNTQVRFLQAQADVVVDQLNYGRYGATAREGMMLGRPTICFLNKAEPAGAQKLDSIENCPLVSAGEGDIYPVLRGLLTNAELRAEIGRRSREFALKWHSADACAERFEKVYDQMFASGKPVGTVVS